MSQEYVNASVGSRIVFFGLIAAGILVWIFSDEISALIIPDYLFNDYNQLENDARVAEERLLIAWGVQSIILFSFAAYFIRLGLKVRSIGQWPLPGMKMPFRTKVVRGKDARDMQFSIFMLGILFTVIPLFGLYVHFKYSIGGGYLSP